MKKIFSSILSMVCLTLVSCAEGGIREIGADNSVLVAEESAPYEESVKSAPKQKVNKRGVVHRVYKSYFRTKNIVEVRLTDGTILKGRNLSDTGKNQPDDFYFVDEGDTIIYDGDDVLEVKFKD